MKKLIVTGFILAIAGCGGGGSSTQPSVSIAAVSSTNTINCNLPTLSSEYPKEYLGNYSIPTATQKLEPSIKRSVGLKDLHPTKYQTVVTDCDNTQYSRLLYIRTLDKLQALGADTIHVYQYAPFVDFKATALTVDKKNWQIPESELIWLLQESNRRNIKVNLTWQLWPMDSKGNSISTSHNDLVNMSESDMVKILDGWKTIAVDLAKLGGQYGLNGLSLDWTAFWFPAVETHKEVATQKFINVADEVRKYFSGELTIGQAVPFFFDNRLLSKVNAVHIMLLPRLNETENINLSVPLLKAKYLELIRYQYETLSVQTGKGVGTISVVWDIQIQSRDKFFTEGWVEDSFCVEGCIQKNYKTDFSVQAIGVEALLQAISEQKYFKNHSVNFHSTYWHTDNVTPLNRGWDDAAKMINYEFPNLSQNIRNKPAEEIARVWFKK